MSRSSKRESGLTFSGSSPNSTSAEITLSVNWSFVAVVIWLLSLGLRGHAAVNGQHRAGHVRGLVGGEKSDAGGDVLGGPGPPSGYRVEQPARPIGFLAVRGEVLRQLGLDQAGRDGVNRHPAAGDLDGQGRGESNQSRLGGGVVRLSRVGPEADDRRDVDHPAEAPAHHRADRLAREPEGRRQVDVDDAAPFIVAQPHREVVRGDAGIVDEHQDRAEVVAYAREHLVGRRGIGNVGDDCEGGTAVVLDRAGDRFGAVPVAGVVHGDGPAIGGQGPRGGCTDSAGGAGDQRTTSVLDARVLRGGGRGGTRFMAKPRCSSAGAHAAPSHSTIPAPQVRPAPKAESSTRDPLRSGPVDAASESAMGMLAAEVLPYSARQSITRSGGRSSRSPTAEMIRELAWW